MAWRARITALFGEFSQILGMRLYEAEAGFALTFLLGRLIGPSE